MTEGEVMKKSKIKNQKSKLQVKSQKPSEGWQKVKLGEFASINPSVNLQRGKDYPFLDMADVVPFSRTTNWQKRKVFNGSGVRFEEDDTLFARITPCLENGKIAQVKELKSPAFGSTEFYVLRGKKNISDSDFIFYLSRTCKIKKLAEGSMIGASGRQRVERTAFENIEVEVPKDIKTQKRIADILSAFDEKIELNNKISKNLEATAQVIFKEWLLKNQKSKIKDQKVEKEEIIDVEKILVFEKGVEPGSSNYSETRKKGFVPFYRVRDLDKQEGVDVYIPEKLTNGKICSESDVLISLDATVGRVKIGCRGAFSSGIRKVYSKDDSIKNSFIYFWLKTPRVQNTILEYASGTTILHAGQSIKYLKLPFDKETINKIQKIITPMFDKILEIQKENQKLAALRELLLPKLMSGEIRV